MDERGSGCDMDSGMYQDIFDIDKDNFKKARPTGGEGTNVDSAFSYIRDKK